MEELCTLMAGDLTPCLPHSQDTLIPFWASGLTSGSWVLARIYDPELFFISSGSKRFGWEVFQFPPGLDQTAQVSKGKSPLSSWVLRALECDQEPHWAPPANADWGAGCLRCTADFRPSACRRTPLSSTGQDLTQGHGSGGRGMATGLPFQLATHPQDKAETDASPPLPRPF